jgi:hypothetical protein
MPRKCGVFAFLGGVSGKGIGKTLVRTARRVIRVELGGDRRAAVREECPLMRFVVRESLWPIIAVSSRSFSPASIR